MRILIIKPSSLGDIIHSLPFLKALRDAFPESFIVWVIDKNLTGVLEGNPLVNELITFDKDTWKQPANLPKTVSEMIKMIKKLRAQKYDIVVDLQGLLRSGIMTFFALSPSKIGFRHAREGSRLFYNRAVSANGSTHAVDKNLEVAKSLGANINSIEFPLHIHDAERKAVKNLVGDISEYAVVIPSARWETKKWPSENFGRLISHLSIPCAVTGSISERETVQQVMRFSEGKGINLCGKTSLKQLIALIAGAKLVISNDSGPMHIGVALGVPVIALFGPTDPLKTGPAGWSEVYSEREEKRLKVLKTSANCAPCLKKKCRDHICMQEIRVDNVLAEVKEYL
jgi:lipopolysaccharide heptosyltransferase I